MTWQLGSTPGVVDAVDAHGRPMPVPLPKPSGCLCRTTDFDCDQGRRCPYREELPAVGAGVWFGLASACILSVALGFAVALVVHLVRAVWPW